MLNDKFQRGGALLAAAVLVTSGLAVLSETPANATQACPTASSATLDLTCNTAAIHVYKREGLQGAQGNGKQLASVPGTPLQGVGFTLYKVKDTKADLSTNAGMQQAAQLTTADISLKTDVDVVGTEKSTDPDGKIDFTGLTPALYYVKETSPKEGYEAAADFLVFLPMTDPQDTTKWMYEVYVYPKNWKDVLTKKVVDADKQGGDKVTFSISSSIPTPLQKDDDTTTTLASYKVVDYGLDPADLAAVDSGKSEPLSNVAVKVRGQDDVTFSGTATTWQAMTADTPLSDDAQTDFYVAYTYQVAAVEKPGLTVLFTKQGRDKLADAYRAAGTAGKTNELVVSFDAKVATTNDGVVENVAHVYRNSGKADASYSVKPTTPPTPPTTPPTPDQPDVPTDPTDPENPGETTPPTRTYYVSVKFKKFKGSADTAAGTGEAEFQVYKCEQDGTFIDSNTSTTTVDPISVNGVSTFATDASGEVTIGPLHVVDYVDNADVEAGKQKRYCLKETKAPVGYELFKAPYVFALSKAQAGKTVALLDTTVEYDASKANSQLVNLPSRTITLPFTGGSGIVFLVLIGAGVVALGVWNTRRRRA